MTSTPAAAAAIARLTAQIEAVEDQLVALRHQRSGVEAAPEGTVQYLRNKHAELADRLAAERRSAQTGLSVAWTGARLFRVARSDGGGIVRRTVEGAQRALRASRIRSYPADDRA